ncbi:MAG: DUF4494 domain-containing protein [Synergistaceae bacterium]|jgi:hypothetical protein|nr:DUF4494 domain-containing protein [Synergistaceae bacterium]
MAETGAFIQQVINNLNHVVMHNWFEVKVNYEKISPSGVQKKVTESYLVDALSHAEAEARAIEELKEYISGEFVISAVRRAKIGEMFFNKNGDRWFKAKVCFIALDYKSGVEKKTSVVMMAQACDIEEALCAIREGMKGTMEDYSISSVSETQIHDIFVYGKA